MVERELKENLYHSLAKEVKPKRLEETVKLCTEIMQRQQNIEEEPRTDFWAFLSDVFRFEGITIFGLQAIILFLACMLTGTIYDELQDLPVVMPLFALAVMPTLFCSQYYGMGEMEAVTRASGAQIILAKLILAGAANLICITMLLCFEIYQQDSCDNVGQMVLYCLVPYLVCITVMLRIIRLRQKENIPICAVITLGSCFCWGILAKKMPELYELSAMGLWIMAFAIFGGFFVKEIYIIVKMRREGKIYGIIS